MVVLLVVRLFNFSSVEFVRLLYIQRVCLFLNSICSARTARRACENLMKERLAKFTAIMSAPEERTFCIQIKLINSYVF